MTFSTDSHRLHIVAVTLDPMRRIASTLQAIHERLQRDRGAAMVEYALLLALAFVVAVVTLKTFGKGVLGLFESVETEFNRVKPEANGA